MQLLKELDINGVLIEILCIKGRFITLRIINKSEMVYAAIEGSRYISVSNGILKLSDVEPCDMEYGMTIPTLSFIDVVISFVKDGNKFKVNNGDRIEIRLKNIANLTAEYQSGEWYVIEYDNQRMLREYIESRCMRLETIEEKFGISIQNISIDIEFDDGITSIKPYCEIIAISDQSPFFDFSIEVGIYDKSNKIIGFTSIHRYKSDFMGFEIFSFNSIEINKPLKEIGKIVFYPTKL